MLRFRRSEIDRWLDDIDRLKVQPYSRGGGRPKKVKEPPDPTIDETILPEKTKVEKVRSQNPSAKRLMPSTLRHCRQKLATWTAEEVSAPSECGVTLTLAA